MKTTYILVSLVLLALPAIGAILPPVSKHAIKICLGYGAAVTFGIAALVLG